jgi:hypothetical protein
LAMASMRNRSAQREIPYFIYYEIEWRGTCFRILA